MKNNLRTKSNGKLIIGEVAPKDMPAINAFIKITGDQSILRSVHCSKESMLRIKEKGIKEK